MKRRLFSIFSTVFFLVMLSLLFRDHIWPELSGSRAVPVSTAGLADSWAGKDEWVSISVNGARLGFMRTLVRRSELGYEAFVKALIQGPFIGGEINASSTLNPSLELEQVRVAVDRPGMSEPLLELAGRVVSDSLLLRLSSSRGTRFSEVELKQALTLNVAADPLMAQDDLEAGQKYSVDVYDPIWGMKAGKLNFELQGLETLEIDGTRIETRVVEATMDRTRVRAWIDAGNQAVRREITIGKVGEDDSGTPGVVFLLEQVREPHNLAVFERMNQLPPLPDYKVAELRGGDEGEPLEGLGIMTMMMQRATGGQ